MHARRWAGHHFPVNGVSDLDRFSTVVRLARWSAVVVSVGIALLEPRPARPLVGGAVMALYAAYRTVRPVRPARDRWQVSNGLLFEVALGGAVVGLTGMWHSPFLLALGVSTAIAGFLGGMRLVGWMALLAAVAAGMLAAMVTDGEGAADLIEFVCEFLLIGVVGGYARGLVEAAGTAATPAGDLERLSRMNDLLFGLHRETEAVDVPMELECTFDWALDRLTELFGTNASAVVLCTPDADAWHVVRVSGMALPPAHRPWRPPEAVAAARGTKPRFVVRPTSSLCDRSQWGIYAPMWAKGTLIGLLAVEGTAATRGVTHGERLKLGQLARTAALVIDNARWLSRIHTFAVEHERARLARDLHDHVGQSVAYLGFELDRLADMNQGRAVQRDLLSLRADMRQLVGELRDTLVDLRADVSEDRDVVQVVEDFAQRVTRRGRVQVTVDTQASSRLSVPVEREVWRICQEAVANAERHSRAALVSVRWHCDQGGAVLEVADDGVGMTPGAPRQSGGYGLVGMHERADSIGGVLDISSHPSLGTRIRLRVRRA